MKKIFIFGMALLVMAAMVIGAYAADSIEDGETAKETVEITEAETETETAVEAVTEADTELSWLIGQATPSHIEDIKAYILYGSEVLSVPEQVKMFIVKHINAIAWIFAGVILLAYSLVMMRIRKSWKDDAKAMTDNAIELAEESQDAIEKSAIDMRNTADNFKNALAAFAERMEKALDDNENKTAERLEKIEQETMTTLREACDIMTALKHQEVGLAEAEVMMGNIINKMIQKSVLPERDKDEFTAVISDGLAKIEEVTQGDEA